MDRRKFLHITASAVSGLLLSACSQTSSSASPPSDGSVGELQNGSHSSPSLSQESSKIKMHAVVLTGSPRRSGNTNYLAEQFMRGAREAGHTVFRFDAAAGEVHPCLGCNHCNMDGPCVYDDDFTKILRPELIKADLIVFCSPMYYFGFSTQLKAVIDRFYAINGTLHTYKKCAFIMAYANTAPKDAEAMIAHYRTIAGYMGWEDIGSVIAPGIWTAGSIKGTKYCEEAYRLGRSLS